MIVMMMMAGLKTQFPAIKDFVGRLAYAVMCKLEPGRPEVVALRDQIETPQALIDEFLTQKDIRHIRIFNELRWTIQDNPGSLKLRTHVFRGKTRSKAVVIQSPNGHQP
jgi:hypothetical protein